MKTCPNCKRPRALKVSCRWCGFEEPVDVAVYLLYIIGIFILGILIGKI